MDETFGPDKLKQMKLRRFVEVFPRAQQLDASRHDSLEHVAKCRELFYRWLAVKSDVSLNHDQREDVEDACQFLTARQYRIYDEQRINKSWKKIKKIWLNLSWILQKRLWFMVL